MNVDAPAPRDMAQESRDSLQAQVDIAPAQFAATKEFSGQYNDLNLKNLRDTILGNGTTPGLVDDITAASPKLQAAASASSSAQRAADLADLQKMGASAVDAVRSADPAQKALVDKLNSVAMTGLDSGAKLDPETEAWIAQKVRASQGARGFGFGNADATAEAYAIGDRGLALQQQRFQNGQAVAGINAATGADPALAVLGRPSQAAGAAQSLLNQGSATNAASGAPQFNPFNGYAQDIFNTNYNGKAAANIAGTNATTSVVAGGLSAL